MSKAEYIYRVEFKEPPLLGVDERTEFYFHSLAAIYEVFTATNRLQGNPPVEHRRIAWHPL